MARPTLEVADIFAPHGPAWRRAQVGHLSLGQLKVMSAIECCRTEGAANDRLEERSPPIFIAASGAPTKLVLGAHAERRMLALLAELARDPVAQRALEHMLKQVKLSLVDRIGAAAEGMRLAHAAARVWSALRTVSRQERQRVAG